MINKRKTYFRCSFCGKITSGRLPKNGRHKGDTTFIFPRRHKLLNGDDCPGNIEEAEWVDK